MNATPTTTAAGEDTLPGRPTRSAADWARVEAIAAEAPPLTIEQRAAIRLALWGTTTVLQEAS